VTTSVKRVLWIFSLLLVANLAWLGLNCYTMYRMKQTFHLRGAFDRKNMVVHTCGSTQSFDLIFTSGQYASFLERVQELGADASEPLIMEFDAHPIPPKWPWNTRETIGIECCELHIEHGKCAD
jgi:hypothetical protein